MQTHLWADILGVEDVVGRVLLKMYAGSTKMRRGIIRSYDLSPHTKLLQLNLEGLSQKIPGLECWERQSSRGAIVTVKLDQFPTVSVDDEGFLTFRALYGRGMIYPSNFAAGELREASIPGLRTN